MNKPFGNRITPLLLLEPQTPQSPPHPSIKVFDVRWSFYQRKVIEPTSEVQIKFLCKYLIQKSGVKKSKAKTGAVTLIQRFGGSINLNVHYHQLAIDGVYELNEQDEPQTFHVASAPTISQLNTVLTNIIQKITTYLEKKKIIIRDNDQEFQLEIPIEDSFSRLQSASVTYRFAMGKNQGKKALALKTAPETDHKSLKGLVVKNSGFSLHAGVFV